MSKNDKAVIEQRRRSEASPSRCIQKVLDTRRRFIDDCFQLRSLFFELKYSAIHSHTVCPMITAFRNCVLAVPAPQRRPFLYTAVPRTFGLPKIPLALIGNEHDRSTAL